MSMTIIEVLSTIVALLATGIRAVLDFLSIKKVVSKEQQSDNSSDDSSEVEEKNSVELNANIKASGKAKVNISPKIVQKNKTEKKIDDYTLKQIEQEENRNQYKESIKKTAHQSYVVWVFLFIVILLILVNSFILNFSSISPLQSLESMQGFFSNIRFCMLSAFPTMCYVIIIFSLSMPILTLFKQFILKEKFFDISNDSNKPSKINMVYMAISIANVLVVIFSLINIKTHKIETAISKFIFIFGDETYIVYFFYMLLSFLNFGFITNILLREYTSKHKDLFVATLLTFCCLGINLFICFRF